MRFHPQTGQPCDLPVERVVVRQAPAKFLMQQSRICPPRHRKIMLSRLPGNSNTKPCWRPPPPVPARVLTLIRIRQRWSQPLPSAEIRLLTSPHRQGARFVSQVPNSDSTASVTETEYDAQNAQTRKNAFLKAAQNRGAAEDYLRYTRDAPLSRYEIKAGWEIPAVLEQSLNSDLPGELKALVTSNVYDTATGQYLLIPQGSRLIGKYDSRVSYGQDGVQVAWNRIIFPDASSIDLDGMLGLDSHGDAGLRDKVDRHYKRLIGMSVLTSMFMAAFAISQNRTQSILAYPTPSQAAETAVGQELSMTGAQMARRNHERAAHYQGRRRLPLHRARQPRHPV